MKGKLSLFISIIALAISIFLFISSQSISDQYYVDVNKLLDGYDRTAVERKSFEQKSASVKANVDSLVVGWQNELKTYEKERSSMSKKELALKQELLGSKQQQLNSYQQAVQKQLQEEDQKATQTVINDVNDFVKKYGKEKGYRIILGATGGGTIMYADDKADLTQEVLDKLNASYKGE